MPRSPVPQLPLYRFFSVNSALILLPHASPRTARANSSPVQSAAVLGKHSPPPAVLPPPAASDPSRRLHTRSISSNRASSPSPSSELHAPSIPHTSLRQPRAPSIFL